LDLKDVIVSDLKFTPLEDMSYEDALQELEELVQTLETGENDLKKTLLYFERGQALASYCISLLDEAELKVEEVLKEDDESS
jgi:exodeoxyribonuclease VII small subunit